MDWLTAEEARDLVKSSRVIDDIINDIMKCIESTALEGRYKTIVTFPSTEARCIYEKVEEILEQNWGYQVGFGYHNGLDCETGLEIDETVEFQISWEENKEGVYYF